MTCRTCAHALCRVERTKDYSVEGCKLGMTVYVPYLDAPACTLYAPASPALIAERKRFERRATVERGEPMEYPG
jgi:hypothetical protein